MSEERDEVEKELTEMAEKFLKEQKQIPRKFDKVFEDNFEDLLATDEPSIKSADEHAAWVMEKDDSEHE